MHVGRDTAYHHCTLLVASNLGSVRGSLRPPASRSATLQSNGTASVRSPVTTIMEATGENDDGGLEGGAIARMRAEIARRIARRAADDFLSWDWPGGKPRADSTAGSNGIVLPINAPGASADLESLFEVAENSGDSEGAGGGAAEGVHSVFELEVDEAAFPHVVYDDRAAASSVKACTLQETLVQQRSWGFQCGAAPRFSHSQRVHIKVAGTQAECDIVIQCERGTVTGAQVDWVSAPPGGVLEKVFATIPVALTQCTLNADGVMSAKSACAAGLRLQLDRDEIAEARVGLGLPATVTADDATVVADHLIDLWAAQCAWY
jgi:hypothetical protein